MTENHDLIGILRNFNFTLYEAKTFITLVKYNQLDASRLASESGVPKPKIYETMDNLSKKFGLIEKIPQTQKKNLYRVKPKKVLQNFFRKKMQEKESETEFLIKSIDNMYLTQEIFELPFVGIGGFNQIIENLIDVIEQAKDRIISFIPSKFYTEDIIQTLNKISSKTKIYLIFHDPEEGKVMREKTPHCIHLQLPVPAFDVIEDIFHDATMKILPQFKKSTPLTIIGTLIDNLKDIFGLLMCDNKKSFFLVPIPVQVPFAIISVHPEFLNFHLNSAESILKASIPLEKDEIKTKKNHNKNS